MWLSPPRPAIAYTDCPWTRIWLRFDANLEGVVIGIEKALGTARMEWSHNPGVEISWNSSWKAPAETHQRGSRPIAKGFGDQLVSGLRAGPRGRER
jgi:hypothetical protein